MELYFEKYARMERDPLCPEILMYNTRNLSGLWEEVCRLAGTMEAPLPFWGIVWPGGRALARYILDHPSEFQGRRVLDLAAGSGIVSIALTRTGADPVSIDIDPSAEKIAKACAALNHVSLEYLTADAFALGETFYRSFDCILAGDVFYESSFARRCETLLRHCAAFGVKNLAADAMRSYRPATTVRIAASMEVPVFREIESVDFRHTDILELTEPSFEASTENSCFFIDAQASL